MTLEPMERDDIESIAHDAIVDALDFIDSEIADDRIKAQRYFDGDVDIGEEEGRSRVVATKVRDAIRNVKPSLVRTFLSNEKFVEFTPSRQDEVQMAETATKYIHSQFTEKNGYSVLYDAFHDALLKKTGVVKVYWDRYMEGDTYEMTNLTDQELEVVLADDNVELVSKETVIEMTLDEMGMEVEMPVHSVRIIKQREEGKLCVESVPPEEFFVDREATSIDDCYICGHRTEMRVGDLVAMGYDFDEVVALTGVQDHDTMADAEQFARRGFDDENQDEHERDPSMKLVAVTEAYMRMDIDGTGVPSMYRLTLGGGDYKLLDVEPCDKAPFAIFEVDPEPHTFFGRSMADLILDDQDASTAILRGVLDNIAMTNMPQRGFVEGQVNIDDLLNNEIGGLVRMKQAGAIQEMAVPFVAGQTLGALEYYDQVIEQKTGVTRASNGLDPDALQNTTATAAQITASAAAGQVEVMARNLAEGGMTRLFKLMLKVIAETSPEEVMMRVMGDQFAPIDPRSWNTDMTISVNVGLGTGKEDQKAAVLQALLAQQQAIFQQYGPMNGMVTMTNIRNTMADVLNLAGVRNADRYLQPMNPQIEQQIIAMQQQMAAQQGQQQVDQQAQALVQAETIKAQAKQQSDMLKIQLEAQKALAADDRERDAMDQDLLIKAAEIIGKYGTAVDVERIKTMQAQPRYPDQAPAQAAVGSRF